MAHTPGPWWVEVSDDSERREVYDGFGHTATVYGEPATAADNARLIAAAPELLSCCRELLAIVEDEYANDRYPEELKSWKRTISDTAKAIAKAEGRTDDQSGI